MPNYLAALSHPQIDPVLISIGPLQIHWYGIAYAVGILFGWWYAKKLVSTQTLWGSSGSPITEIDIDDFLIWAVIGIILGGRVGYILFYDLPTYLDSPLSVFALWQGGMSFHGGLAGITLAMILFARRQGFTSDAPWAVIFPGTDGLPRHPSQLYEGLLEGVILFVILAFLIWKRKKLQFPGFIGGTFLLGYGFSRIAVEFFRLPDAQLGYLFATGWITMGMMLSLPILAIGLWAVFSSPRRAAIHA